MTPAQRRAAAGWLRERYTFSERRACRLVGIGRTSARYRTVRGDDAAVRARLRALAAERPRFGYRRLHALLRREGIAVNHKRVQRLYGDEGLAVRRRSRKRLAREGRGAAPAPARPDERWGLDFVSDALAGGRRIRLLCVLDLFTREALAIEVAVSLPGARVVAVLDRLARERGGPADLVLDNGPELTGRALDGWAAHHAVRLRFISLADARTTVEAWRLDDHDHRPHSALGYRTPREIRAAFPATNTTTTTTTTQIEEQTTDGLP